MALVKSKSRNRITAELKDGKGFIRIVSYIQEWNDASAFSIRQEVDRLISLGAMDCDVYINSRGGDVFEATEIANELSRFNTVNVFVGAVAASAATYICAKFHTTVKRNTQVMVHKPKLFTSGTVEEVESDLKLAKNLTEEYKNAYAEKTGKTPEQIVELWSKGDYWMTAQEAKDHGFVDAIESEEVEITEEDVALLTACAAPNIPKPKIQNSNQMDRLKLIAALGLAADATDAQIEAKIAANKQAAEEAAQLRANAEQAAKIKAEALVDGAIVAKKITAEKRDQFVKLASADYDSTKEVLDAMKPIPQLSAQLERTPSAGGDPEKGREGWTLYDYLDKDPEAYAKMKEENPERAKKLEAAYFGKIK